MIGVRPTPTARYVPRPRLLARLPDAPGHVVWLEAPYGYGKSVLTMQWAERLEAEGWRVVWASLAGREPLSVLARALEAPSATSWGAALEALWSTPTLLVLEDLEGSEAVEPLLKQVGGMVALSSRQPLPWPALPPLLTSGRLVHLGAADLAFTEAEAEALLPDREAARRLWRETAGWSLPLHFASLTGSAPDRAALVEGVRASVSDEAWSEALLVATLDVLPSADATDATRALANAGFVQRLDAGYRLHPLAAEVVLDRYAEAARAAVAARAGRLPSGLRGRAYARVGLLDALRDLMEDERDETYRNEPSEYLRWHGLVAAAPGPVRRCHVAVAKMSEFHLDPRFRDVEAGIREATDLALDASQPPRWRARAALAALFTLAELGRLDETGPVEEVAEALADELPPFEASRVSRTLVTIEYRRGNVDAMERHVATARAELARAADDPRQGEALAILDETVAQIRFELYGEVEPARVALAAVLDRAAAAGAPRTGERGGMSPVTVGRSATMLAVLHRHAGDDDGVRTVVARWLPHTPAPFGPFLALQGAAVDRDLDAFPRLMAEVEAVGAPWLVPMVAAEWLLCLLHRGDHAAVERLRERYGDAPTFGLVAARVDAEAGRLDAAEAALSAAEHTVPGRGYRALWLATAYLVRRDARRLDELCGLLDVGAAVLRSVDVPLATLPRDRPDLAVAYPLSEVVASGWSEAIAAREHELPRLELRVLGGVAAYGVDGAIDLSERQRQLLVLLAMGVSRDAIGEALWPETEAAKVRNNLNVLMNGLRKALQPWGLPTYLFESGLRRVESDLERVEVALKASDWDAVTTWYAGPLGAGVDVALVREAAGVLERRVLEGLREAAAAAEPERAIAWLDRLLELDPLHEEALHDLVVLLLRNGRRREARRRYRALADRLHDELGVAPPEATRRLLDGV